MTPKSDRFGPTMLALMAVSLAVTLIMHHLTIRNYERAIKNYQAAIETYQQHIALSQSQTEGCLVAARRCISSYNRITKELDDCTALKSDHAPRPKWGSPMQATPTPAEMLQPVYRGPVTQTVTR